jgi:hypothetical protein
VFIVLLIIILTRRAAQSMVQIDGILWTIMGKKLIHPDSVKKWSEVEKQKRNHRNNSKGFQTNRPKGN